MKDDHEENGDYALVVSRLRGIAKRMLHLYRMNALDEEDADDLWALREDVLALAYRAAPRHSRGVDRDEPI